MKLIILMILLLPGCFGPSISTPTSSCNTDSACVTPRAACENRIRLACVERIDAKSCGPWAHSESRLAVGRIPGASVRATQNSEWYVVSNAVQNGSAILAFQKQSGARIEQLAGNPEFFLSQNDVLFSEASGDLAIWDLMQNVTQRLDLVGHRPLGLEARRLLVQLPNGSTLRLLDLDSGVQKAIALPSLPEWSAHMKFFDATLTRGNVRIAANESYRYESEGYLHLFTQIMTYRLEPPFTKAEWTAFEVPFQDIAMTDTDVILKAGFEPVVYHKSQQILFPEYDAPYSILVDPLEREKKVVFTDSVPGGRFALIGIKDGTHLDVIAWDSMNTCYHLLLNDVSPNRDGFALSEEGDLMYLENQNGVYELVRDSGRP